MKINSLANWRKGFNYTAWQWQPAPHDPNPPLALEDPAGVAITGTGDVTAPAGAILGTALETFSGSGNVTAPAGTILGSGLETFAGSGSVVAPAGAIGGTGAETFSGSGNVTAPAGAIDGSGTVSVAGAITGSGDVTAPVGAISGTGTVVAAVVPVVAPLHGGGVGRSKARGIAWSAMIAQQHRARAAITGSGGMTAPPGQIAATGHVQAQIRGSGGMVAPVGSMQGYGRMSDDALVWWLLGEDEDLEAA